MTHNADDCVLAELVTPDGLSAVPATTSLVVRVHHLTRQDVPARSGGPGRPKSYYRAWRPPEGTTGAVAWAGFAIGAVGRATVGSILIPEPTLDPFVVVLFG